MLIGIAFGYIGNIDAGAVHIELPAMIDTAKPAILVASKEQGGASVWAVGVENANVAIGVSKAHQVFTQ
jgi:hypothetical protein